MPLRNIKIYSFWWVKIGDFFFLRKKYKNRLPPTALEQPLGGLYNVQIFEWLPKAVCKLLVLKCTNNAHLKRWMLLVTTMFQLQKFITP